MSLSDLCKLLTEAKRAYLRRPTPETRRAVERVRVELALARR